MLQRRRRSGMTKGLLSLGLLAGATLSANSVQAVDAVGPYYAMPAWDQSLPAATRFVVLTNWNSAAVLDKETGLVWERSPKATPSQWDAARKVCTASTTGGRKGWRLPSVHELTSLNDRSVSPPGVTLPSGHPFLNVLGGPYWSAMTASRPSPPTNPFDRAYMVFFTGSGTIGFVGTQQKNLGAGAWVWCVRGAMNADAY